MRLISVHMFWFGVALSQQMVGEVRASCGMQLVYYTHRPRSGKEKKISWKMSLQHLKIYFNTNSNRF